MMRRRDEKKKQKQHKKNKGREINDKEKRGENNK